MATKSASEDVMKMECFICNEMFTDPKLLPCFHTFCRHCLLSLLTTDPKAPCPLCKRAIADPTAVDGKDVVDNLPTDLAMEALVNSAQLLRKDRACNGCCNEAAVQICLTCGDIFCHSCSNVHQKMSATRNHKVEDLSTMTPERLAASEPTSCSVHSERSAELFCQTHAAVICPLCATSEHRACPEVMLFEKRVEDLRAELAEMSTILATAETEHDKVISKLDQQMAEAEIKSQKVMSDIDADCDRLENALKDCRNRLKKQVLNCKNKMTGDAQDVKDTFLERKEELAICRISVDRIKRAVPSKLLSDANLTLRSKIKDLDLTVRIPVGIMHKHRKTPTVDREALERLEKELNNLGFGQVTHATPKHDVRNGAPKQGEVWLFHPSLSKNITLLGEGLTAKLTKGSIFRPEGIALSSQPMRVNKVYEIVIDRRCQRWGERYFSCGVTQIADDNHSLQDSAPASWKCAVVFSQAVHVRGSEVQDASETLGDVLDDLPTGSCVGLMVDSDKCLHLLVNRNHVITLSDTPTPCYAFFELRKKYKQITTLPLRELQ